MGFAAGAGDNSEAQDFGDRLRGIDGAVDAVVGELIGRQTLGVEGAKTGFVAEERAASHGHATAQQDFRWGVEPEDGNACGAKKFGAAGLRVGAATEGENYAGLIFRGAAQGGAELIGFELAERRFAEA